MVEMLLALALCSVVMSGLVSVYWGCSRIFAEQAAYTDAHYSARSSIQQMTEDIRSAATVEILDNGTQLRLSMVSGELVRYYQYNHQLFRESIASRGAVRLPIAENISYLQFSATASLVNISIDATVAGKSYRLSTAVNSRLVDIND